MRKAPRRSSANAVWDPPGPFKIDDSCVFWTYLEGFVGCVLESVFDRTFKGAQRFPKGSKMKSQEVILRVRGEYLMWGILEEGPPMASREVILDR